MNLQAHLNKLNQLNTEKEVPAEYISSNSNEFSLSDEYYNFKAELHENLTRVVDLSLLENIEEGILRKEIRKVTMKLLDDGTVKSMPMNNQELLRLLQEIEDEVLGLGPLEVLMKDPSVSDILVNAYNSVYVERYGKVEETKVRFKDNQHLMQIIEKIVSAVGRRVDEVSPMVDARLADGSRVNVIIPPLSLDGPCMSIRRFAVDPLDLHDLIVLKTITPALGELLTGIVKARLNVLISGGTGSGKTTLLNVMSQFVSSSERIVTIEDSAELQLRQRHVIRLETRPPNVEGEGEITQRNLVRNSLRMRPDRIIVGEVRGAEAIDMLQAMNTGHDGSLTTIHANSPADALMRIETMVNMAGFNLHSDYIKRYISSAIDVVIQVDRLVDGSRKLISLSEITGMEGEVITMQEIMGFEQTGIEGEDVIGHFEVRGVRPKFFRKFKQMGIKIEDDFFDTI